VRQHWILPTIAEVRKAVRRLRGHIVQTPLILSPLLSKQLGGDVYLKLETAQTGGSFKIRGALNALFALPATIRKRGVVASSAGNHGLGIAIAAARLGMKATVFVPRPAPAMKRAGIAAFGATVDATQPDYDSAEVAARAFAKETGARFVSPCTGHSLLAGAATIAVECHEALPTMRSMVVSVGGGGLAGGVAAYLKPAAPDVQILGAQSERTNAMALAMRTGRATTIPDLPTLADGLAGAVDAEMVAQGHAALTELVTVPEKGIAETIAWCALEHRLVVEGAGAVGIAALRGKQLKTSAFPLVVVVSGANIDPAKHAAIVAA
jgi:threonine dehydratase